VTDDQPAELPHIAEAYGSRHDLEGYVVLVPAERPGFVEQVWIARDTRGRMVPIAAMVIPDAWTFDEDGWRQVVEIDPPEHIWAAQTQGLSSRDRLNIVTAMDHVRERERSKEAAWANLDEEQLRHVDPLLPPRPRGKGERPPTDDELAHASLVYLVGAHKDPRRPIVEAQRIYAERGLDVDLDSIRHYVRMARLNRFLTASTAGRAGAEPDVALLNWYERWRIGQVTRAQEEDDR
jgi:hypothetical protein